MSDYNDVLEEIQGNLPELITSAKDEKDLRIIASFYNLSKFSSKTINPNVIIEAFNIAKESEPQNLNDFYSILLLATKKNVPIVKNAYPQWPLITSDSYDEEYNLDKWSNLVYKIYDAVLSRDMSMDNAIDYYANTLDKKSEEGLKFTKWIKSHLNGDQRKYAEEGSNMKKESNYQFGLNGSNFYYPDSVPIPEKDQEPVTQKLDNQADDIKKREDIKSWKSKIDGAIRRIDKLIRTVDVDAETSSELFNSLHNFNMAVHNIKSKLTASDFTIRTANSFKKLGFSQGHDILIKTAQEVEDSVDELQPSFEAPTPQSDGAPGLSQESPSEATEATTDEGESASADPIDRVYDSGSGAKEGEYEELSGDTTMDDAISKLEEVAARLADRRVVRLLAEFDIMLDKLGIAAMFPELAESQSKLIDAYSYSMVRTTRMLGMLSSGKSLSEISTERKKKMVGDVRKDVDKAFKEPEAEEPSKQEVIADEFTEDAKSIQDPVPEPTPEI